MPTVLEQCHNKEAVVISPSSHFSDIERTFQARHLIVGNHKVIGAHIGVTRETISRYALGTWPVPAYRAFAISACQNNFVFVRSLAARVGLLLLPRRSSHQHYTPRHLLTLLVLSFGRFLVIAEKVNTETPLTDAEMQILEDEGEAMKQAIDALIEKAREHRAAKNKE